MGEISNLLLFFFGQAEMTEGSVPQVPLGLLCRRADLQRVLWLLALSPHGGWSTADNTAKGNEFKSRKEMMDMFVFLFLFAIGALMGDGNLGVW